MKRFSLALAAVLSILLSRIASPAISGDQGAGARKSPEQLACEKACHEDHAGWVDQCIAFHDPREILPSARGQCIDAGAERLQACLEGCR